jgi:hypothetical protein
LTKFQERAEEHLFQEQVLDARNFVAIFENELRLTVNFRAQFSGNFRKVVTITGHVTDNVKKKPVNSNFKKTVKKSGKF